MELDQLTLGYIKEKTRLTSDQIKNTLTLFFDENCTLPFIARYRKERTQGLDEVKLTEIKETYDFFQELLKRRAFILDAIEKQGKLTPDLSKKIQLTTDLNILEDIYAPYKIKRETKGQKAIKAKLGPLAELIKTTTLHLEALGEKYKETFINLEEGITSFELALKGAEDIIVEEMAHNSDVKNQLRQEYWKFALIESSLKKDAEKNEEAQKYKDYFEYSQKVSDLLDPKVSHRFLALKRGSTQKILKVDIIYDQNEAIVPLKEIYFSKSDLGCSEFLRKCAQKALSLYIHPSLDLEIKSELKKSADEAAIEVFSANLRNLLLSPYLGPKVVIGIDPGIRTGCKVVTIDNTGKLVFDGVIYPHLNESKKFEAQKIIEALIIQFKAEHIVIGNGTYGRETLDFVKKNVSAVKDSKVHVSMISESGASIYSASPIAREEFPDKDVTVRGAVSIARRFQDPLAELVKIDPKSIGVGQYQHDVNQIKLKKSLGHVVENCVNYVGVDLNTASAPLLSYISGIGPQLAKQIVSHREKKGLFKKRQDLLEISRFGQKNFEQAAGFLRIYEGENPLDGTFIHPERYSMIQDWSQKNQITLKDLIKNEKIISKLEKDKIFSEEIGHFTHADIVKSLKSPSQDPRSEFQGTKFNDTIETIKDLKIGQWYNGVVTNITQFGAFVDIGIKENGLLHISQIQDQFVENPLDVLKVGQEINVKVIDIDFDRKRISLSRKNAAQGEQKFTQKMSHKKEKVIPNNPFAKLKDIL